MSKYLQQKGYNITIDSWIKAINSMKSYNVIIAKKNISQGRPNSIG